MSNYKVSEIGRGIYLLKEENVCIYVVCGSKYTAVIDTGYGTVNLKEAVKEISKLPQIVLLTHGHPDHFYGMYYYDRVYVDQRDIPLFGKYTDDEFYCRFEGYEKAADLLTSRHLPELLPMKPEFDLGQRTLEVINLSGHTSGSVGFLLKEERILFSGDGLTYCVWLQLQESSTVSDYLTMLLKLKKRSGEFDYIYNGHSDQPDKVIHIDHVISLTRKVINEQPGEYIEQEEFSGILAGGEACQMIYLREKL